MGRSIEKEVERNDWENQIAYRRPSAEQQSRCANIREGVADLGRILIDNCPDSRERSLALTKLEEALSHSIAAIVRE